jgi:hypothetical protein
MKKPQKNPIERCRVNHVKKRSSGKKYEQNSKMIVGSIKQFNGAVNNNCNLQSFFLVIIFMIGGLCFFLEGFQLRWKVVLIDRESLHYGKSWVRIQLKIHFPHKFYYFFLFLTDFFMLLK